MLRDLYKTFMKMNILPSILDEQDLNKILYIALTPDEENKEKEGGINETDDIYFGL